MLVLSRAQLAQVRAHARAAAPAECCGLLIGRDAAGGRVVARLEPVPNAAHDAYAIPPAVYAAAERAARRDGAGVCGVYHSHPAGSPLPSPRDREAAWPGLDYLIVGADGAVRAWRLAHGGALVEVTVVAAS